MVHRFAGSGGRVSLALVLLMAGTASAATSLSNSLTGFTGDSSLPATQAAVAAAGFNFSSTDSPVVFDANGAHFGTLVSENAGRDYMRTIQTDYANISFVAEVTLIIPDSDVPPFQSGFLGIGPGDLGFGRWPDWGSEFSSVMVVPELYEGNHFFKTLINNNNNFSFGENTEVPGLDNGTHRLRMSLDWFAKTFVFSIDFNYGGGPFVTDYSSPVFPMLPLYGADGWPAEPARIYFGGDDGTAFKDFQVTVSGTPIRYGDLNGDTFINSQDWVIFRTNQATNLSSLTLQDAYFRGDLDANRTNDLNDFVAFKNLFDGANGVGSFAAMLASVPEPAAILLILPAGFFAISVLRLTQNRD
jgi:hypothetical protein